MQGKTLGAFVESESFKAAHEAGFAGRHWSAVAELDVDLKAVEMKTTLSHTGTGVDTLDLRPGIVELPLPPIRLETHCRARSAAATP